MKLICNIVGLSCGVVGALFMFFYGIPNDFDKTGSNFLGDPGSKKSKKRGKRYDMLSKFGVLILSLGFLLQLISNFLPN